MNFWDKLRKKTNPPEETEYHRQPGRYDKNDPSDPDQSRSGTKKWSAEDPEALKKLYEDDEVKARLEKEMGRDQSGGGNSVGQMIGKGVGTLGDSLKRVSTGRSLLDEEDQDNTPE